MSHVDSDADLARKIVAKLTTEDTTEATSGLDPREAFADVVLASRIADQILSTEFPNEEALQKYLKDHPKANPSNHSVKKPGPSESPESTPDSSGGSDPATSAAMSKIDEHHKKLDADLKRIGKGLSRTLEDAYNEPPPMSYNPSNIEHPMTKHQRYLANMVTNVKNKVMYPIPPKARKLVEKALNDHFGDLKVMQKMDGDMYSDYVDDMGKKIQSVGAMIKKLGPKIEEALQPKAK